MTCIVCGVNFCWLCGAKIGDGLLPDHYQVQLVKLKIILAIKY